MQAVLVLGATASASAEAIEGTRPPLSLTVEVLPLPTVAASAVAVADSSTGAPPPLAATTPSAGPAVEPFPSAYDTESSSEATGDDEEAVAEEDDAADSEAAASPDPKS